MNEKLKKPKSTSLDKHSSTSLDKHSLLNSFQYDSSKKLKSETEQFICHVFYQIRKESKFTQMDVAEALERSQGFISKIENRSQLPDAQSLLLLPQILNFPIDWFIY